MTPRPFLHGENLVVPSPTKNTKLVKRMRAYGFTFFARFRLAKGPAWIRCTRTEYQDKVWTTEQWLELATKCHVEAYGPVESVRRVAEHAPNLRSECEKRVGPDNTAKWDKVIQDRDLVGQWPDVEWTNA